MLLFAANVHPLRAANNREAHSSCNGDHVIYFVEPCQGKAGWNTFCFGLECPVWPFPRSLIVCLCLRVDACACIPRSRLQTHDLEDHLQLMGGIIDSKVAAIDEATKKCVALCVAHTLSCDAVAIPFFKCICCQRVSVRRYSDLAGLNKLHMTLSELEELQSRQTGLLEQTTELLNLKRQQILS